MKLNRLKEEGKKMSYKALYRTYRPTSFEEVVGQKHIVTTLMNAAKQNKIAHAYLFCGPRGTGKTSIARLLAKAVNCENQDRTPCNECSNCQSSDAGTHQDIVEIDAASSSGVDQIRDLIEKVKYSPIQGRYKAYIIDEVHMLSQGAFNALLKTLEEPPEHVLFILATTEPHKVLATIISRCQRYDFTKVSDEEIISRLNHVLGQEKIEVEPEALRLVATLADGGMRDALSILDQCIAYAQDKITLRHVNDVYGITTVNEKINMLERIVQKDAKALLSMIQVMNEKGIDIRRLTNDLIEILKESVIYAYTKDETLLKLLNEEEAKALVQQQSPKVSLEMIDVLMETTISYRNAANVASYFEVAILKMVATVDDSKGQEALPQKEEKVVAPKKEEIIQQPQVDKEEILEEPSYQEEVVINIPQKEEKQKKGSSEILYQDTEFILGLLVQADKESKEKDREAWQKIESKTREIETARWANLLKMVSIAASGQDFILVSADQEALANQVNELENNKQLYQFLKNHIGIDKMIIALSKQLFEQVTISFVERRKTGTLPPKSMINKHVEEKKEEVKQKTKEEQLADLFGSTLTIIEEEE